jgi:hypothetical protein
MLHLNRAAVDQSLAFVLGHELNHAQRSCAVTRVAPATIEARLKAYGDVQVEEKPFCKNPPSTFEYTADLCGLAAVAAVSDWYQNPSVRSPDGAAATPGMLNVANRMAIDMLGLLIVGGLGSRTQEFYRPEVRSPSRHR